MRRSSNPVIWFGDSLRELKTFPNAVQDEMGSAIYLAQHRADALGHAL
jgi:phage-related protein